MVMIDRNECRTVEELRSMARAEGWTVTNWRNIAARLAGKYGYIVAWLACDTMVVFSLENGKVHRKTHRRNWRFAA